MSDKPYNLTIAGKLFLLVIGLGCVGGMCRPNTAHAEDEIAAIIQHNLAYARALQPAYCTFVSEGKTDDGKFAKVGGGEQGFRRNGFFLDYVQQSDGGPVTWSEHDFYDGKRTGFILRHEGMMEINHRKVGCLGLDGKNALLEPFVFLTGKRYTRSGYYLTAEEMSDPAEWKAWADTASISRRERVNGEECVVVACEGGKLEGAKNPPFIMLVWFDAQRGYYPVRWQRISDQGKLISEYEVMEFDFLDESKTQLYPKSTTAIYLDRKGKIYSEGRMTVTRMENNAQLPEGQFTIDPMLAGIVFDSEVKNHVNVFYPKSPGGKKTLLSPDKVMSMLYAGSSAKGTAKEPVVARNGEPIKARLLSDVIERTGDDDFTVFDELAATGSTQAIPVLLHYISLNDAPDETRAVAAGAALAKLGAEDDLREQIVELSKESSTAADAHRAEMFNALAFMRSAGAVRVVASFLGEAGPQELTVGDRNARHNPSSAAVALNKMTLPDAPRMEFLTHNVREADLKAWRDWWSANREKYGEKGLN